MTATPAGREFNVALPVRAATAGAVDVTRRPQYSNATMPAVNAMAAPAAPMSTAIRMFAGFFTRDEGRGSVATPTAAAISPSTAKVSSGSPSPPRMGTTTGPVDVREVTFLLAADA